MDASEELLVAIREIRDQQRRILELLERWKTESDRDRGEWREEWRQQSGEFRSRAEKADEWLEVYTRSARLHDEANQLYVAGMKRREKFHPYLLIILILTILIKIGVPALVALVQANERGSTQQDASVIQSPSSQRTPNGASTR